ncbi:tetratricopeptide repeat protein [Lignipirellula cremea]|uniref:Tetratricopeptide repeat protein n=1 Tax=Lignipirellula cremea TaxID=2528010 RepID=A0A518DYQ4_9BACT|nr:tetratricopeptide repeat protein [Lignipirellula cremea]QDU96977.1 Tetratricopeptide repeat protein [Lignipirellula cremea]
MADSSTPDTRLKNPPLIWSLLGTGTLLYGHREENAVSSSVVKTQVLCLLFLPLFALGAWRVTRSSREWRFLSRARLSLAAKAWNAVMAVVVPAFLVLLGWVVLSNSAEATAQRHLEQAQHQVERGNLIEAAEMYRDLSFRPTRLKTKARAELIQLMRSMHLSIPREQLAGVYGMAAQYSNRGIWVESPESVYAAAMALIESESQQQPYGALTLLDQLDPVVPAEDQVRLRAMRENFLKIAVENNPQDPDLASRLGQLYERQGRLAEAKQVLSPLQDFLGDREGARVLAQIFASEGDFARASRMMAPYCRSRLVLLEQLKQEYHESYMTAEDSELSALGQNDAPEAFYQEYQLASPEERDRLVNEYVDRQLESEPNLEQVREDIVEAMKVVPLVLDLGIWQLHMSQQSRSRAGRRTALRNAERTFLSIAGFAEETDEYRLSLGKVYYWLGNPEKGARQFERLLTAHQRDGNWLITVSQLQRQLGQLVEARRLMEEAFHQETDLVRKQAIANLRAMTPLDLEDQIYWLEQSDLAMPQVQASLFRAQGGLAETRGNRQLASERYRQALEKFEELPENASTLNDCGLAYLSLYRLTGDPEDLQGGIDRLQKAMSHAPDDAIILTNAAMALWRAALREMLLAQSTVPPRGPIELSLLSYWFEDDAGRQAWAERLAGHQDIQAALQVYQRVLVLAPSQELTYEVLREYAAMERDTGMMEALVERAESNVFDLAAQRQAVSEYLPGTNDEQYAKLSRDQLKILRRNLAETDQDPPGVLFAIAANRLAYALMSSSDVLPGNSPDEVVELAEQSHAAAPSFGTRLTLIAALLFRANQSVAQQDADWNERVQEKRRRFDDFGLIGLLLEGDAPARKRMLENADFLKACAQLKIHEERTPGSLGPIEWSLLRHVDQPFADQLRQAVLANQRQQYSRRLDLRIRAFAVAVYLQEHWIAQMENKAADAAQWLQRAEHVGQPLTEESDPFAEGDAESPSVQEADSGSQTGKGSARSDAAKEDDGAARTELRSSTGAGRAEPVSPPAESAP